MSEVHDRAEGAVPRCSRELTWPQASIPQSADPFTQDGHDYVLEMDEYADLFSSGLTDLANAPVGAARIINVDDPRHPFVVSELRLEVHQADVHGGEQYDDPGASSRPGATPGTTARCRSATTREIAGCSMIASGLRLFDISDVEHPREVAYFNRPGTRGQPRCPTRLGRGQRVGLVHRRHERLLRRTPARGRSGAPRP